jgi:hypothetical protein
MIHDYDSANIMMRVSSQLAPANAVFKQDSFV